jgi:transcriptional regulator with XRE-family HTH domain
LQSCVFYINQINNISFQGGFMLAILMSELASIRNRFDIRATELARRMGMTESTFSRFQQRESVEEDDARRYLAACGFDEIEEFMGFHRAPWALVELVDPSWQHPDREVLHDIVRGAERLEAFAKSGNCDEILAPAVTRLKRRLTRGAKMLASRDHTLAFMGEPGRFKTTTIARMAGLWRDGKPRLPVGSGLTTVCEMVIRSGTQAAIDVVPHEDVDVQAWVKNWAQGKATDGLAVTPEIDRALRSMSGLSQRRKRGPDGKLVTEDPLQELRAPTENLDQLTEEVMRLINLPGRRTRSLICPDGQDAIAWLETTIANINSGKQPDVSLPKGVTITLPRSLGPDSLFRLTAVDTKGIDGTTQREDLMTYVEDQRTISILCSLFHAIDGTLLRLLRQEQEARMRAAEEDRVVILMLAKGTEAEEVLDDSGTRAGATDDGYLIKETQIRQVLKNEGFGEIPIVFFNAYEEEPERLWDAFDKQLRIVRGHWSRAAKADLVFVDRLERETDLVRVEEGFSKMAAKLGNLARGAANLSPADRHPKRNLLEEIDRVNASVLAASMRRQGRYTTFSVPYVLATGCRIIANARSKKPFDRVAGALEELGGQFDDVGPVRSAIESLREDVNGARQDFLRQVQDFANRHFTSYFEEEAEPERWERVVSEWGRGGGYRGRVTVRFDEWFEDPVLKARVDAVQEQTTHLWRKSVVQRLETAREEARSGTRRNAA